MSMLRVVRLSAIILLVLLAALWGVAWLARQPGESPAAAALRLLAGSNPAPATPPSAGGLVLPEGVTLGGPFRLTDHTGRVVTEAAFAGRWALVYFGFTYCPDVCPTELGTIAQAIDLLGPSGDRVTPVLVSIDPARDTPQQLADYVDRFHPRLVGLTGTEAEVADIARRFRVFYARARSADTTDYLMDHSSFIYLVGPDFLVRAIFRPNTDPQDMANAILARLAR